LVAAEENGDKKNGGGKKIDLLTTFLDLKIIFQTISSRFYSHIPWS
jgi:hypothetical protein